MWRQVTRFTCLVICLSAIGIRPASAESADGSLLDGLIGYWSFDDGTAVDLSGEGHDGTVIGASFAEGISGQCLSFDGIDDCVEIGTGFPSLGGTQPFTVVAWVKDFNTDTERPLQHILSRSRYLIEAEFFIDINHSYFGFLRNVTPFSLGTTTQLSADRWTQVVAVYDGAQKAIYVDGQFDVLQTAGSSLSAPSTPVLIGAAHNTDGSRFQFYQGLIDELRIYDRALSANEIATLYNQTADPTLIGYWSFDDGTAVDLSGKDNHGTVYGCTPTAGLSGQGMHFDGDDDWINMGDRATLDGYEQMSFSLWLKFESFGVEGHCGPNCMPIFSKFYDGPWPARNSYYLFDKYSDAGNVLRFALSDESDAYSVSATHGFSATEWHNVVCTFDGDIGRIYRDGKLINSLDFLITHINASTEPFRLGACYHVYNPDYMTFHGSMDEVRFYSRALSESDILDLYNSVPHPAFCEQTTADFCDDFEDGPGPGWSQTGDACTWEVIDGRWHASLSGIGLGSKQLLIDDSWQNYVVDLDVLGTAGVDKVVTFRANSAGDHYDVNLRSDWNGQDELFVTGTNGLSLSETVASSNGIWYHLTIALEGSHISVSVNGAEVLAYDDITDPILNGGIGLYCHTGTAAACDIWFDNVAVTLLDPPPHVELAPESFDFTALQNGALPESQTLAITNAGGGTLDWYVDEQISWLDLDIWQGVSNYAEVTLSINSTDLTPGTYDEVMTVYSSNADNQPLDVPVTFEVSDPGSIPVELEQYDVLSSRLRNLELDIWSGIGFAVINDYDMGACDNFVDTEIRTGGATSDELEGFYRLLLAAKLINAGYRYEPDEYDPLPETEPIQGAEIMWDAGIRNTVRVVLAGFGLFKLAESSLEKTLLNKLVMKIVAAAADFMLDIGQEIFETLINNIDIDPDDERTLELVNGTIRSALAETVEGAVEQDICWECLVVEPIVRPSVLERAISLSYVPSTQSAVDWAAQLSAGGEFIDDYADAEARFESTWQNLKGMTDQAADQIAYFEAQAASQSIAATLGDLTDQWSELSSFAKITKLMEAERKLLGVDAIGFGMAACVAGYSTAWAIDDHVRIGVDDIYGHTPMLTAPTPGLADLSQAAGRDGARSVTASTPQELDDFVQGVDDLVTAVAGADSTVIFMAADSLGVLATHVDSVFNAFREQLHTRYDSARVYVENFGSLAWVADSVAIECNSWIVQAYLVCAGLQLNPYDVAFNQTSEIMLDSAVVAFEAGWNTLEGLLPHFNGVVSSPTLSVTAEASSYLTVPEAPLPLEYAVTNTGDFTAAGVWGKIEPPEGLTVLSADSIWIGDVEAGQTQAASFVVSVDPIDDPYWYYQALAVETVFGIGEGKRTSRSIVVVTETDYCCTGKVGDANGSGDEMPTIGDISTIIDAKFISGSCEGLITCFEEADVNLSAQGSATCEDITIGDISMLIDYLFITGPEEMTLPDCP